MREFKSFAAFAEHLLVLAVADHVVEHRMLEHACVEIEKRAKEKIGEYQDRAGPFAAWAPLAESTKEDRVNQGYPADGPGLRSGDMRDEIEHKVVSHEGHVGSDDDKLLWFELGTIKQPARSVLGGSAFELAPKIVGEIGAEFTAFLSGGKQRIVIP